MDKPTPCASSSTGELMPSTSSFIGNSTPSTPPHATRSNYAYGYSVDINAVLAIGVCVFFAYNASQLKIKNPSMKNKISNQSDIICFRSDDLYNKCVTVINRKINLLQIESLRKSIS